MRTPMRPHRSQQGSVYIITLVVLLVLTVLGLSIALITQSEMQIGINERLGETMFYAAGSGIDVATAKALVTGDMRKMRLDPVPDLGDTVLQGFTSPRQAWCRRGCHRHQA